MKIQSLRDVRSRMKLELQELYSEPEINALASIIIRTMPGFKKLHQIYDQGLQVSPEEIPRIVSAINQLKEGIPIQYILGSTEFHNCKIRVNRATLIPRPETEELVDLIIRENRGFNGNIADIGTGSGCIAIALAKGLPDSAATGTDISDEALNVARGNAELNEVTVKFIREDILKLSVSRIREAGILVSNPPYVRDSEKHLMKSNVINYEPASALFVSDSDPLIYYRSILQKASIMMLPDGKIYFEINEAMGKDMISLLKSFTFRDIILIKDINGKDRFIKGRR